MTIWTNSIPATDTSYGRLELAQEEENWKEGVVKVTVIGKGTEGVVVNYHDLKALVEGMDRDPDDGE